MLPQRHGGTAKHTQSPPPQGRNGLRWPFSRSVFLEPFSSTCAQKGPDPLPPAHIIVPHTLTRSALFTRVCPVRPAQCLLLLRAKHVTRASMWLHRPHDSRGHVFAWPGRQCSTAQAAASLPAESTESSACRILRPDRQTVSNGTASHKGVGRKPVRVGNGRDEG